MLDCVEHKIDEHLLDLMDIDAHRGVFRTIENGRDVPLLDLAWRMAGFCPPLVEGLLLEVGGLGLAK